MYFFHTQIRYWFLEQWSLTASDFLPPPDLAAPFRKFARGGNLSWLPDTSFVPQFQPLRRPTATIPALMPAPVPASNPSPIPAPAPGNERPSRTPARNLNRDTRYVGGLPLAKRIRRTKIAKAIELAGDPPAPSGGGVRCLTWHIKGNCFADCDRCTDHICLDGEEK